MCVNQSELRGIIKNCQHKEKKYEYARLYTYTCAYRSIVAAVAACIAARAGKAMDFRFYT